MDKDYSVKKKKILAKKIGKIKNKRTLCNIIRIIQKNNKLNAKEVNKHLFLYFHKFTTNTYTDIEKCIKEYEVKRNLKKENTERDDSIISTDEIKPYTQEELMSQKNLSPQLKYSNKERSLIKRRIYDNNLNE